MKDKIDIVKEIADGMIGIGGIPSNEEFYTEFDMRLRAALRIQDIAGRSEQLRDFAEYCDEFHGLFIPSWMIDGYNIRRQLPTTE